MIKHNVGDRVIALSGSWAENLQPRKRGKIYIVEHVMFCHACGVQFVNIGYNTKSGNLRCGCGKSQMNHELKWTYSKEFAPITEEFIKQMEEEENYEMCALIKKELDISV